MGRGQTAICQHFQLLPGNFLSPLLYGVAEHMPGTGRGVWLLRFGRQGKQMIGPLGNVFQHPGMESVFIAPFQPLVHVRLKLDMEHPVDQGGGHGFHNRPVLRTVSCPDDHAPLRQMIFSDSFLQNQGVKRLLHLLRTAVQLIQKQAVRFRPRDHSGRPEGVHLSHNLRDTDDILRGKLASQQGNTGKPHAFCKFFHQRRFSNSGRPPDKDRAGRRDI